MISAYNIVELIYHSKTYRGHRQGLRVFAPDDGRALVYRDTRDAARALAHPEIFQRADNLERFQSFDYSQDK